MDICLRTVGGYIDSPREHIAQLIEDFLGQVLPTRVPPRNARWQYIATRMLLLKPQLVTLMFTGVFELDYDLPVSPYLFKY